jgi:hypothetical protein
VPGEAPAQRLRAVLQTTAEPPITTPTPHTTPPTHARTRVLEVPRHVALLQRQPRTDVQGAAEALRGVLGQRHARLPRHGAQVAQHARLQLSRVKVTHHRHLRGGAWWVGVGVSEEPGAGATPTTSRSGAPLHAQQRVRARRSLAGSACAVGKAAPAAELPAHLHVARVYLAHDRQPHALQVQRRNLLGRGVAEAAVGAQHGLRAGRRVG